MKSHFQIGLLQKCRWRNAISSFTFCNFFGTKKIDRKPGKVTHASVLACIKEGNMKQSDFFES